MKAKLINEVQSFERYKDPGHNLGLGLIPKKKLELLISGLKELGINSKAQEDYNMGKGYYFISLEDLDDYEFDEDDPRLNELQCGYGPENKQEEWEEGFWIASDDGDPILSTTPDYTKFIQKIISLKFGNIKGIDNRIKTMDMKIQKIEKEKVRLENIKNKFLK